MIREAKSWGSICQTFISQLQQIWLGLLTNTRISKTVVLNLFHLDKLVTNSKCSNWSHLLTKSCPLLYLWLFLMSTLGIRTPGWEPLWKKNYFHSLISKKNFGVPEGYQLFSFSNISKACYSKRNKKSSSWKVRQTLLMKF